MSPSLAISLRVGPDFASARLLAESLILFFEPCEGTMGSQASLVPSLEPWRLKNTIRSAIELRRESSECTSTSR